jgi:hypothetical protein
MFLQFLAYFVVCVWLVPFGLFVSLSVNDNVLPTHGTAATTHDGEIGRAKGGSRAGILVVLDGAREFWGRLFDNLLDNM